MNTPTTGFDWTETAQLFHKTFKISILLTARLGRQTHRKTSFCAFNSTLTIMACPAMMSRCPLPWCPITEDLRHWRRGSKPQRLWITCGWGRASPATLSSSLPPSHLLVTQESLIQVFKFIHFENRGSLFLHSVPQCLCHNQPQWLEVPRLMFIDYKIKTTTAKHITKK